MGYCPDTTEAMGVYSVEVRRESFWLRNEMESIELGISEIPQIRAALDLVEEVVARR